jgi:hypothetical protein
MSTYNFKKEAKVYLVQGTPANQYNIDISNIQFSQTFMESSYPTKTIQTQNMFEGSVVTKANPSNFEFTFPALREDDLKIVFDKLLDYQSFDLYISTLQDVFKLRNCVITNGNFIIERLRPLSMTVSGEATQLSKVGSYGSYTIPGTVQSRDVNRTYNRITFVDIQLGDTATGIETLSTDLVSLGIELQNKVRWKPFSIVGKCDTANTVLYPENYYIDSRILAGTVTRHLTDTNNDNLLNWDNDIPLSIEAGQEVSGTTYGFVLDMDNCSFTNRLQTGNVYTQSYDWRMTQNPTDLADVISYVTL